MIGYICGEVAYLDETQIIVDNHGIGYQIFVPGSVMDSAIRVGREVKIYSYLYVKEDILQLYGFLTRDDLQVFQLLLGVNGVGPKAALAILSALGTDTLRFAVLSDDAATIAKAPGIGKKTAQKLILELKDKFHLEEAFEKKLEHTQKMEEQAEDARAEAVQALAALGYSNADALRAVKAVENADSMDVETLLKAALKKML